MGTWFSLRMSQWGSLSRTGRQVTTSSGSPGAARPSWPWVTWAKTLTPDSLTGNTATSSMTVNRGFRSAEAGDILKQPRITILWWPSVLDVSNKSLMQLPRSDFTLMKSLISLDYWVPGNGVMLQEENTLIGWAVFMYDLLDRCQFERFWQELAAVPERVDSFVGFYDSIRQYVCYTIGLTYQNVDLNYAMKLLGLSKSSEIQPWIKKQGWQQSGNTIFCGSQQDKIKTKNITEKLELSKMQDVIARGVTERGLNSETYVEN